jgi:hypothetical protein
MTENSRLKLYMCESAHTTARLFFKLAVSEECLAIRWLKGMRRAGIAKTGTFFGELSARHS